ncbi:MAG: bifunctional 4-hydroxy-2-oxoglutarate aldolase/2-dehydro-3-deoxy-phosphogluconate aldolase [Clostridia bacterium]|nr:bifunctional 4-hydroxy-2-oxoglutarate aldolase/2-dehydro-3-deoxy-phosphogluconate aldolase [Clostridia bacterium]
MRNSIIEAVSKEKLIVIVRGIERGDLVPLAEAMYTGGVRLLEITYSANGAISDEETADRIGMLAKHFAGRMFIGAGTVLTEKQVELTAQAGGGFIISPDTNVTVIKKTREMGLVSMPGALTPTEIMTAHNAGADFVKLFPIDNLGVGYVKAIKAPLSQVSMLAVGGVGLDNIPDYKKLGISGFGIGSNIIDKKLIAKGDFDGIAALAKKYVDLIKE